MASGGSRRGRWKRRPRRLIVIALTDSVVSKRDLDPDLRILLKVCTMSKPGYRHQGLFSMRVSFSVGNGAAMERQAVLGEAQVRPP